MNDSDSLHRFHEAQQGVFESALAELRSGRKQGHWMWFIFPQINGLGFSDTARFYAIRSLDEAAAYLADPVLGQRLRECAHALLDLPGGTAREILGSPDDLKLRSSMTLFAALPNADPLFSQVLQRYYGGLPDQRTIELISPPPRHAC